MLDEMGGWRGGGYYCTVDHGFCADNTLLF